MEVLTNLVRGRAIQKVHCSGFWDLDGIIRWALRPYICRVRPHRPTVVLTIHYGHYRYFLKKNDEIYYGKDTGVHINLKVLGIGDGITVQCSEMSRWMIGY